MTHDELTGRPILPRDQLRHGAYYRRRCRNALIARWDAERGVFWHWRQKLDRIYLERIKHPTDEPRFDVFRVVEEWPNLKFEIPIPLEDDFPKDVFMGSVADLNEYEKEMWSRPGWEMLNAPNAAPVCRSSTHQFGNAPPAISSRFRKKTGASSRRQRACGNRSVLRRYLMARVDARHRRLTFDFCFL